MDSLKRSYLQLPKYNDKQFYRWGIRVFHLDPQTCLAIVARTYRATCFHFQSVFQLSQTVKKMLWNFKTNRCLEEASSTLLVRGSAWAARELQRLQQHRAACARLSVINAGKKTIGERSSRVSADADTRQTRKYRPDLSADRYIGRSLVLIWLNWKNKIPPTHQNLLRDVMQYLQLEKIKYSLRKKEQTFYSIWQPFINYYNK